MEVARGVTDPEEYDAVWQILGQVAEDGEASLRYGIGLLGSPDPVTRSVGCNLLGCASDRHESVRDEAASALLGLVPDETDADVAWSLACALGRTADERAIPVLVSLAGHPGADVRCQVAQALPAVATGDFGGIEVGVLVRLTGDPDADVREWATFGLGSQLAVDTPAVRAALWARIRDDSDDVREEAVFGLARRVTPGPRLRSSSCSTRRRASTPGALTPPRACATTPSWTHPEAASPRRYGPSRVIVAERPVRIAFSRSSALSPRAIVNSVDHV